MKAIILLPVSLQALKIVFLNPLSRKIQENSLRSRITDTAGDTQVVTFLETRAPEMSVLRLSLSLLGKPQNSVVRT